MASNKVERAMRPRGHELEKILTMVQFAPVKRAISYAVPGILPGNADPTPIRVIDGTQTTLQVITFRTGHSLVAQQGVPNAMMIAPMDDISIGAVMPENSIPLSLWTTDEITMIVMPSEVWVAACYGVGAQYLTVIEKSVVLPG